MLSVLAFVVLAQTQPAVRRSTPLADDPGQVTRNIPSGTQNVFVTGGSAIVGQPDGGLIGTVFAIGPDGGAVPVQGSISATNPSVGPTGSAAPAQATLVGGPDSSNLLRAPFVLTTTPDAGDPGLVVRIVGGSSGGGGGVVTQGTLPWLVAGADGGAVNVNGTVAVSSVGGTVTVAGTVTTTPPANASTNVTQFGGSNVVTGTGVGGVGVPRVTVSSDSTVGVTGTVTVAGTVAATQSGTWNINNVSGTVSLPTGAATETTLARLPLAQGSTTSGQFGPLEQGAVTTGSPTYTTGTTQPFSLTTAGALRVDGSAVTQPVSGTVVVTPPANATTNITQFGGSAVVTGTGASGAGIPRVTVANDSTVTANAGTGTFTVGQATPGNLRAQTSSESNTAAAVPAQASMVGGSDGTNLRALRVATDGTVRVDPTGTTTQPISGTVTANAGQVAAAANDGACVSVTASTTVLASNASRRQAALVARLSNTDTVFIKFGATATTADFPLEPGQAYNLDGNSRVYTGVIDAIANSGTQSVCVTEFN